jgi:hypothetical protein
VFREVAVYLAHAFGQRYELPLPLVWFVIGGGVAVVASFLLVLPRSVAAATPESTGDGVAHGRLRPVRAGVSFLVFAGLIVAGVIGAQEPAENILPTVFWLLIWIAVPLSCGLIGDWTTSVNPFAALARLADSDRVRAALLGSSRPIAWPRWLGWWPPVVAFFVIACGELIYNQTATLPAVTASALLVWAVISAAMGLLFGAQAWLGRGEVFSVLFATWGRLGFFRFGAPGRRGFAGGVHVPFEPVTSRLVFVLMLLVSVSFDGLISTPTWQTVNLHMNALAGRNTVAVDGMTTLAFLALSLVTLLVFGAFAVAVARAGGHGSSFATALAGLLPSLLPIAFGYLLAHNLEYLATNGQLLIPLLGNPTGLEGWQWLPPPFTDDYEANTHLLPSAVYWYTSVAVIVLVHIAAVVLAHRHLATTGQTRQQARRSEYPWLVAMVCYTMVSLWLLAQPLVEEKPADSGSAEGISVIQPAVPQ